MSSKIKSLKKEEKPGNYLAMILINLCLDDMHQAQDLYRGKRL